MVSRFIHAGAVYRQANVPREELPDVLYHGTSMAQIKQMRDNDYWSEDLYVGEDIENVCEHYAEEQSRLDGSDAAYLTLDTDVLLREGSLVSDVHPSYEDEEELQLGQWIYSGPFRNALLRIENADKGLSVNPDTLEFS